MKSLRRKIGVVMQGGKLMWGDIFSNITVSAPWLTLDDAWEAAEIAGMADDIRAMPMGMRGRGRYFGRSETTPYDRACRSPQAEDTFP